MRKFAIAAAAALTLALTGASAEEKVVFQPGFQYSLGVGATCTPSDDAPFASVLGAPYAGLAVTWDFCAPLALRIGASYAGAKTSYDGATRSWSFQHAMASADLVLDICNAFRFNKDRGFSPYVAAGFAYDLRFGNTITSAEALKYNAAHLCTDNCRWWSDPTGSYAFRASAGIEARVSDKVRMYLELTDNFLTDRFNSLYDHTRVDQHLALQVGVKLTVGQARKYARAHAAYLAAIPVPAAGNAEAERLLAEARRAADEAAAARDAATKARAEAEALLAQAKAQVQQGITIAISNPLFSIGKADLNDIARKNLNTLAEALKANPQVSIDICGYADRQTGNPELNWSLSRRRAEAVLDALTFQGVPASQIHASWKGDTEAVSDTQELNRTVVITIAD